jgi:hypothetical protein
MACKRWGVSILSVTLIATVPGCLGSFTAVSLFLHGVISRGI